MIVLGSIGWDDEEAVVDMADRDADEGTLVRVQLFQDRDMTKPLTKRAQGTKIVCQIRDGLFEVPPKDATCYVAIPDGMEECHGIGLIIGTVTPGGERKRNVAPGNKFLSASEGSAGVIINTLGAVTLHTTSTNDSDGASVFFRVSPTAFQFVAPWGRLIFDASGVHWTTKAGARLDFGGITVPGLSDALPSDAMSNFASYFKVSAGMSKIDSGSIYLGAGQAYNPALHALIKAPPLAPPQGVSTATDCLESQTVYIAP